MVPEKEKLPSLQDFSNYFQGTAPLHNHVQSACTGFRVTNGMQMLSFAEITIFSFACSIVAMKKNNVVSRIAAKIQIFSCPGAYPFVDRLLDRRVVLRHRAQL